MCTNCGQVTIPTLDETPLPCNEFISDICVVHPGSIPYLGLEPGVVYNDLIEALISSLVDARNRIQILEQMPMGVVVSLTGEDYTLSNIDNKRIIKVNSSNSSEITIPLNNIEVVNIGFRVTIVNEGLGQVNLEYSGVTLITNESTSITTYNTMELIKVGVDTWVLKK